MIHLALLFLDEVLEGFDDGRDVVVRVIDVVVRVPVDIVAGDPPRHPLNVVDDVLDEACPGPMPKLLRLRLAPADRLMQRILLCIVVGRGG